jgi:lipid II:glycine glycyltransferase (peptidoglycan interpeptide bridge formation enzyme)
MVTKYHFTKGKSDYLFPHTVQLNRDTEMVAKTFKRQHRQNIRTAEKKGVRVEWGDQIEHLRLYYQLQLEIRRRQVIPVQPWKFFEYLASVLFSRNLGSVLLAYVDEESIAGVVYLHWQKYLVAKYAASKDECWQLRTNNLLF